MQSREYASAWIRRPPPAGRYCSSTIDCGTTEPLTTVSSSGPVKRRHSPLTATCPFQPFTGPAPRQVSPDGQSAFVSHDVVAVTEHVFGATGCTRWRAFATRIADTVTRTCVRVALRSFQPATKRPAKPVGIFPRTFFVMRIVTSSDGLEPVTCLRTRTRAGVSPKAVVWPVDDGGGSSRKRGLAARVGSGRSCNLHVNARGVD